MERVWRSKHWDHSCFRIVLQAAAAAGRLWRFESKTGALAAAPAAPLSAAAVKQHWHNSCLRPSVTVTGFAGPTLGSGQNILHPLGLKYWVCLVGSTTTGNTSWTPEARQDGTRSNHWSIQDCCQISSFFQSCTNCCVIVSMNHNDMITGWHRQCILYTFAQCCKNCNKLEYDDIHTIWSHYFMSKCTITPNMYKQSLHTRSYAPCCCYNNGCWVKKRVI